MNIPFPKRKKKKVIGLMKDELGGKMKPKFVGLRAKTYSHLIDDGEDKKAKNTKKCAIKRKLKFENDKNCSEAYKGLFRNNIDKKTLAPSW